MDIAYKKRVKTSLLSINLSKKILIIEADYKENIKELRTACPVKGTIVPSLVAVIPNSIGKSEKFLEKSKVLDILQQLDLIHVPLKSGSTKKLISWTNETNENNFLPTPSHLLYRRVITPYTPGVVRIRSQTKLRPVTRTPSKLYFKSRVSPITKKVYEDPFFSYKSQNSKLESGYAEKTYKNKDWYKGNFKKSRKQGIGQYFYSEFGLTYTGSFHKDKFDGFGALEFSFGHKIECHFSNGAIDDTRAEITYSNTCQYKGEIFKAQRQGIGSLFYPTGEIFKGFWDKDQRAGFGVVSCPGQLFFEGFFNNDHTDGAGVLVFHNKIKTHYPTQSEIEGLENIEDFQIFTEFLKHSIYRTDLIFVTLSRSSQHLPKDRKNFISGKFSSGKLNGVGKAKYGELGEYVGEFKDGLRHGFGVMKYEDPKHLCEWFNETEGIYTGEWREDKRHGQGTMEWNNGTKYEGMFLNDIRDQVSGKLTFINGDTYTGTFINNNMANPKLIIKHKTPE